MKKSTSRKVKNWPKIFDADSTTLSSNQNSDWELLRYSCYVMNFGSKFGSNPGTIAVPRVLVFRFLFFWFRFGFVFVLLSVDWNILLMSSLGHAQFNQPIRLLPDTMDLSELRIFWPMRIENHRSSKMFSFSSSNQNTHFSKALNSQKQLFDDCKVPNWKMNDFFELAVANFRSKLPNFRPRFRNSGILKILFQSAGIYFETSKENHGALMIYFIVAES